MKKITHTFLILLVGILFSACQDKGDDCIYLDKRLCDPDFVIPEISEGIVTLKSPIINYERKILLEDFTGFRCTNCVPAAVTAANLKAAYPNRLSVASVHCTSFFAAPLTADTSQPFHRDFRTPEGEQFVNYYELLSLPTGAINRLGSKGNKVIPYSEWTDRVNEILSEVNPEVYISIEKMTVDEDNQEIIAEVYAKPLVENDENYLINISVTESGIAEAQKDNDTPGGTIYDYIHNHVYRGSGYGPWGIDVFKGDMQLHAEEVLAYKLKIDINPEWVLDNCRVIVFISKSSNREVVQTEEIRL